MIRHKIAKLALISVLTMGSIVPTLNTPFNALASEETTSSTTQALFQTDLNLKTLDGITQANQLIELTTNSIIKASMQTQLNDALNTLAMIDLKNPSIKSITEINKLIDLLLEPKLKITLTYQMNTAINTAVSADLQNPTMYNIIDAKQIIALAKN